ncbi:tyrosine-type recombinase/integrase [Ascidiimonas sp. W6]|uniref:tyrosine-type recombinase/integrase n=1 Tax=Ascidiimonas meishanensis TaxID=3128903 RepID=UPI0030EEA113
MSIQQFLDYLSLEKKYSDNTIIAYQRDIQVFQAFCKDEMDIKNIDIVNYGHIRHWIVSLVDNKVSNRSINRKIAALKAYYKFLLKCNVISANPLLKHKALKTQKKVEIPFSLSEMEKVLAHLKGKQDFESVRDCLIVELFYTTGIRRSELINLKCGDVNKSERIIKVLGKRNKERIIPLLNALTDDIKNYLVLRKTVSNETSDDFFFLRKNGNKLYETLVYRIINNYFSKASAKAKTSPHILRHTFATHMLSQGADLNSVKELLGHSSLASTQVYTHNSITELKKVYAKTHPRNRKNLDD